MLDYNKLASDIPQIARGRVWCRTCGREQSVKGSNCLQTGWPKCHGATMTIDSPEERRRLPSPTSTGAA